MHADDGIGVEVREAARMVVPEDAAISPPATRLDRILPWVVAGIAVSAAILAVKLTLIRPYCTGDSASYLGAARNLAAGRGLTIPWGTPTDRPLVHFPPLYPAVLGAVGSLGPDPLVVSRWMNAVLLGLNAALAALAVYGTTRNRALSCLAAVLMAASPVMLRMHTAALSEPLFVFLLLAALAALHAYARRPSRRLFLLACDATALALLCRWAGAPLVATGALVVCAFGAGGLWKRLARAAAFGLLSCLPAGLWMLRNLRLGGTATNRTWAAHPVTRQQIDDALRAVSGWGVPGFRPGTTLQHSLIPLGLLCLAAVCFALYLTLRRGNVPVGERLRHLPWAYAAFLVTYCAFLLVSVSYCDRLTPLDNRILLPAYAAWLVGVLAVWPGAWMWEARRWAARRLPLLPWLAIAVMQVHAGARFAEFEHNRTRLSASSWNVRETRAAMSVPWDRPVYSNRPEDYYIYVNKVVKEWPSPLDVWSGRPAPGYKEKRDAAVRELTESGGRLVLLGTSMKPWLDRDQIPQDVPLVRLQDEGKVHVYAVGTQPARRGWPWQR
ncbi:MAG: phospholipid carrier-dependent glycosyltransferase [Candidatus Brocadiaceae bacterium]|nr:phospholipid carrier-dependent glycosyltransferase [Candidatus Brocadiaceae bacterium]